MKIDVCDSAEFKRLLEALVHELLDAREHFHLHQGLAAASSEYAVEFNQAAGFWSLTMTAHIDATLIRVCKAYDLYDGGKPSLNLRNFLETIQANLEFFDEPNFRERLKDNPYVDSLAKDSKKPDPAQLQKDLDWVTDANPLVKKLTIWRHNFIAHRSRKTALAPGEFTKQYPLAFSEIESLITKGTDIVNEYSRLFNASHYVTYQADDYKYVLEAIREHLERREARIQEEIDAVNAAENAK